MIPNLSSRGHYWSSFSCVDHITLHRCYHFQPHQANEMFWLQEVCDQITIAIPLVPAVPLGARRLLVHIHCYPHLLQPGSKREEGRVVLGSLG